MDVVIQILDYELLAFGNHTLKVFQIVRILLIIIGTKILLWIIKKALFRKYKFSKIDS